MKLEQFQAFGGAKKIYLRKLGSDCNKLKLVVEENNRGRERRDFLETSLGFPNTNLTFSDKIKKKNYYSIRR